MGNKKGNPGRTRIRYALVYPNTFKVGMANLGFQMIYGYLTSRSDSAVERHFADHAKSLESGAGALEADVVAFSLSFEGDYPAASAFLAESRIPPASRDRGDRHPLVLAGGTAPSLNPEPLALTADVIYMGEAESAFDRLHLFFLENLGLPRKRLLEKLAGSALPGVYVPSAYAVEEGGGPIRRTALYGAPERIAFQRAGPGWEPARSHVVAPGDAFGGAFLIEISRGCPHGCRFCAAGHLSRPFRVVPFETIKPLILHGLELSGRVGLVGAAVSDHPDFVKMAALVAEKGGELSVSSFRAENTTPAILELMKATGLRTLTVAIEAGSPALRARLGKEITGEDLVKAASMARKAGLKGLRVYGMAGLPGETGGDAAELAKLALAAKKAFGPGELTLSVAPFVPKPHTPFQWEAMEEEKTLTARIRLIKSMAEPGGVKVQAESPKWARVQGLFSRGGRRVGALLAENPPPGEWTRIMKTPQARDTLGPMPPGEAFLPWNFVTGTPDAAYLAREKTLADKALAPLGCDGLPGCEICGICG